MANMTVRALLDMVEVILQDSDNVNWDLTELLKWYNLACRQTVIYAPEANPIIEPVKLAAAAKHTIPAGGLALINIIRNMGTDGLTPGVAIFPSTVKILQAFEPDWNSATAAAAIDNFMPETDRTFYSYPPGDGTGYVEMEYSKVPTAVIYDAEGAWETLLVGVTDKYVNAIKEHILASAYAKDTDYPGNLERSQNHMGLFAQAVGAPMASEAARDQAQG